LTQRRASLAGGRPAGKIRVSVLRHTHHQKARTTIASAKFSSAPSTTER